MHDDMHPRTRTLGDAPIAIEVGPDQLAIVEKQLAGDAAQNVQDVHRLSPLQEGMLFHHLLNEHGDTYVLSTLFELQSSDEVEPFARAVQAAIDHHDVLRSTVLWEGLQAPVQVVYRKVILTVEKLELGSGPDLLAALTERMKPQRQRFNLTRAPLVRLQIAQDSLCPRCYALLQVHHIICDHQSLRTLVAETLAVLSGKHSVAPRTISYRDLVGGMLLSAAEDQDARGFFREKLGDVDEPTAPFGFFDVHGDGDQLEEALLTLDQAATHMLRAEAQRAGFSPARLFHGAWALVVAQTSGREDVVFGTVLGAVRGRRTVGQGVIGMFVNTLPLRIRLRDVSVLDVAKQTDLELTALVERANVPLTLAQGCSSVPSGVPLFTTLFNFRHNPSDQHESLAEAQGIRVLRRGEAWSNYPISITVDAVGDIFQLTVQTDRRIGASRIARYLSLAVQNLAGALARAPSTRALDISILPESERQQLIQQFNADRRPYPHDHTIHELIQAQAAVTPDIPAVVWESGSISYAQLEHKANQLASYLRLNGAERDHTVGLCVERGLEMFIGILGILKSQGAYVPLDPEYPSERLAYMLADVAPQVVLTQTRLLERLPPTNATVVALDDWTRIDQQCDEFHEEQHGKVRACGLAYVIYTSGSTGRPKGVMIEHRHVMNLWQGLEGLYDHAGRCQRVALNASVNFDASVQQIAQLLSGRTVYIVPQRVRQDAARLVQWLREHQINAIDCTPSQLNAWISAGLLEDANSHLKLVLVGGEAIDAKLWSTLADCRSVQFFNVYGPTECTVDSTVAHINHEPGPPHIGRPLANRNVYILNERQQAVPVGVAGEIYIGGAGVARGYLNRPELTAQRFLPNAFNPSTDTRLYKTGDVGRWQADGTIEYLGRNDDQVKVRGFRIELGEIEAQLTAHEQICEAAVIAREDVPGDKRLVAYVVPEQGSLPLTIDDLRSHLKARLPDHMIPSAFVVMGRMPLTPSGKLDRRALPAPDASSYARQAYEAPRDDVEVALATIWQDLLHVGCIGRNDNFFELGGHSLLIMKMLERLRQGGWSSDVRRVFDHPTLAGLSSVLTPAGTGHVAAPSSLIPADAKEISPAMLPLVELQLQHIEWIVREVAGGAANIEDIYPLAPLQEGILFHHLLEEHGGDVYVVPTLLQVSSRERADALISSLQRVIDRHDVMRTSIFWEQLPQAVQVVQRRVQLPVEWVELSSDADPLTQVQEWVRPQLQRMDLRRAPLMRLRIGHHRDGSWYAFLQLHHIVGDNASQGMLISEVVAQMEGRSGQLPVPVPYRNHVAHVLAQARTQDAGGFFSRKLADLNEPTAPFGLLDVRGDGDRIAQAQVTVDAEITRKLRSHARRLAVSPAAVFHAAWALVVACTSSRYDVVFGSVLLGRLSGAAGAQRTLGMFINTLPLRLRLDGVTAEALVQRTQRELVDLMSHEQASLAVAQRCSGISANTPLFTALFNYRHSAWIVDSDWSAAEGIRKLAGYGYTNYPLTVSVDELQDTFELIAQTDRRIDPGRMAAYLSTALESLLDALEQAPHTAALSLAVVPTAEKLFVLEALNPRTIDYPKEKLIHELFEEQVARTPDAIAVTCDGRFLTYEHLNRQADQLSQSLSNDGVGPDRLVGICAERSLEMVVGLLGILKAGGAYLPLDPSHPPDRLQYMIEDAAPLVVLSQRSVSHVLPSSYLNVLDLDVTIASEAGHVPPVERAGASSSNLLYVIFTSGSTGRPKGTAMPHASMVNLIEWHRRHLSADGQRVLQFSALSFDVSFQETFSTLCTGGTLVLLNEQTRRDARALLNLLRSESVTRVFLPPMMLQGIAESSKVTGIVPRSLRDVVAAGEQLRISPEIVELFAALDGARLHNHYGPTETHVVTTLTLSGDPCLWPTLPTIGQPIENARIYTLDERRQVVPLGAIGEIYIGGENLAREYLHRPDLTQVRFVLDPFDHKAHARMYRTGDLARWRADGTIEYLGRNDDQVKIRGYRIELAEIEAQLILHAAVKEVAVIAREDMPGDKRLVAYVSANGTEAPDLEDLRNHLKARVPEYMVPSAFTFMERLPVTPSGKINRRALPAPDPSSYAAAKSEPPQGNTEERLAQIFEELLCVKNVGRNDNFFELGGHSLLVLRAVARIEQNFGCALSVSDFYKNPRLRELAMRLGGTSFEEQYIDLQREAVLGPINHSPLSKPQYGREQAILLTGATGFVGRFLLWQLLQDTQATIYCLVRGRTQVEADRRLRITLGKWDLWSEKAEHRMIPVSGDLRLERLGLDKSTYELLCDRVDTIYHCGTSMNHLETYAMAKAANVDSARELLTIATTHKLKRINFISTLGVFRTTGGSSKRVVNEDTPIDEERYPSSMGYAGSKWVAEKIFMLASKRGIPCNIFRVGLVWADSEQGRYDELQRGYRILKSSLLAGVGIENFHFEMPPTPVDYVARAIVHLASRHPDGQRIFHISASRQAPRGTFESWNDVAAEPLELVSFYAWTQRIKQLHQAGNSLPIVPLIEYSFLMDEKTFLEQRQAMADGRVVFSCDRTHMELEEAGIIAPVLDGRLVELAIRSMLSRDVDMEQLRQDQTIPRAANSSLSIIAAMY